MADYNFERESRTPYSECFVIEADGDDVGRVDLHFTPSVTYGTLCVPESFTEDDVQGLIADIDERLVMTNDPYREDFVVTVWVGRQSGVYSEEDLEEEEEDEEEEEMEGGNGHKE